MEERAKEGYNSIEDIVECYFITSIRGRFSDFRHSLQKPVINAVFPLSSIPSPDCTCKKLERQDKQDDKSDQPQLTMALSHLQQNQHNKIL